MNQNLHYIAFKAFKIRNQQEADKMKAGIYYSCLFFIPKHTQIKLKQEVAGLTTFIRLNPILLTLPIWILELFKTRLCKKK